jgi:hypothetical protein
MLFALLAVAAIATAIAFPDWVHAIVGRGDSSRIGLWRHYLELSRDRLWLGRGLDFDPHFRLGDTEIYTPHNILVAALVRSGLVGLSFLAVAMAGALLAALVAALRGWWLPLVVLASALTLSSVDHEMVPSAFGFYWYLFWLPLGLAAAAARSVPQAIRPRPPLPAVSRSGSGGAPAEQPGDDRIQT